MSGYAQRLLSRVAPAPAAAPRGSLGPTPVAPIRSPIAEVDQRIGVPDFDEIFTASDVLPLSDDGTGTGTEVTARPTALTASAATIIEPAVARTIVPMAPADAAPLPPADAHPVTDAVAQIPEPPVVLPKAVAPFWRPPFAIDSSDFEPAPRPPIEMAASNDFAMADDVTSVDSDPAPMRKSDTPPTHAMSLAEPVSASTVAEPQPAPRSAAATNYNAEPAPARAATATSYPEAAEAAPLPTPAPYAPAETTTVAVQPTRSVVIQDVVIEVTPPPAARLPTPNAESARAPQTAAAASLIGPLPARRSQTMLFGMRRG